MWIIYIETSKNTPALFIIFCNFNNNNSRNTNFYKNFVFYACTAFWKKNIESRQVHKTIYSLRKLHPLLQK